MKRKKIRSAQHLTAVYHIFREEYGFQNWWPGDTRLEIVVGAVLTQNTNWTNVERALVNIFQSGLMNIDKLLLSDIKKVEELIRPSGFYKQKAARLLNLLKFLKDKYNWNGLDNIDENPEQFRRVLLSQKGIGPETADSILCYAFDKKFFVVDAYTKRLLTRIPIESYTEYEDIRMLFEFVIKENFGDDLSIYKDFHAQIVMHAKQHCRVKPICDGCLLQKSGLCIFPDSPKS